ncbi:hypothetical protein [Massilia glaciei]|uniref:Secreted protein n=1 Tax=Massilia glaciei TaxID=1524097 RepID=A0A2U2HGH6_9BURK|nr:hypothetical protein [Massilia glaciei]PWF44029.1 hypothetical protein C7C56_019770 [Massilia glaciei]
MNFTDAIKRGLIAGMLTAAGAVAATPPDTAPNATQMWHGTVQTPNGEIDLELAIHGTDPGKPRASLESVTQAPGLAIPVSAVSMDDKQLRLEINQLSAEYEGKFDAAKNAWEGVWRQAGMHFPLTWSRGALPPKPRIGGIDGDWRATLHRAGKQMRLTLRIASSPRGTRARLDSPDVGALDMNVTELSRTGDRVHLRVPLASVVFEGELSDKQTVLTGAWLREGLPPVTVKFSR